MGKYKLTKGNKSKEEVEKEATNTSWERIMQVATIACESSDKITELENKVTIIELHLKPIS